MGSHSKELPIPNPALGDHRALELVRVWAAKGEQHVSLATGVWEDPASWGIMLVDLAKHIANAYEQVTGQDRVAVLRRLKEGFDAEWEFESDEPVGTIME